MKKDHQKEGAVEDRGSELIETIALEMSPMRFRDGFRLCLRQMTLGLTATC
jgi:hypothetical protein